MGTKLGLEHWELRMQMEQSITHGVEVIAPKRHLVFAYYVSGHGFGHATRVVEVNYYFFFNFSLFYLKIFKPIVFIFHWL